MFTEFRITKSKEGPTELFFKTLIMNTHPSNYAIAIRKDGKIFRVPLTAEYGAKYPDDNFSLQLPSKPCAFRDKFFDVNGRLRSEFWNLPIIYDK